MGFIFNWLFCFLATLFQTDSVYGAAALFNDAECIQEQSLISEVI